MRLQIVLSSFVLVLLLLFSTASGAFAQNAPGQNTQGTNTNQTVPAPASQPSSQGGLILPFNTGNSVGVGIDFLTTDAEGRRVTGIQAIFVAVQNAFLGFRPVLGPVLVILIFVLSIRLILARGNEEKFQQVASNFLYILIGILFISFANS